MNASESSEGFLGYQAGSYDVTFSLRKGFCPCATQNSVFFGNIGQTSGVGRRVVEEFCSCCCFLGKLFFSLLLKNFVAASQLISSHVFCMILAKAVTCELKSFPILSGTQ